jgi:hypothetical protein
MANKRKGEEEEEEGEDGESAHRQQRPVRRANGARSGSRKAEPKTKRLEVH